MAKQLNPHDIEIGKRVRLQRLSLDMSQGQLGKSIGLTFQQVQKYEKGTNRIGGSRMIQIAEALHVNPAYFFGNHNGNGKKANGGSIDPLLSALSEPDTFRMMQAFNNLGSRTRKAIRSLIVALGEEA